MGTFIIFSTRRWRVMLLLTSAMTLLAGCQTAHAQACGQNHIVRPGQSLSSIAERVYGDTQKWTVIHNINIDVIGSNPNLIQAGQRLRIPCLKAAAEIDIATAAESDADGAAGTDAADSDTAQTDTAETDTAETDTAETDGSAKEITTTVVAGSSRTNNANSASRIRFLTADDYAPFTDRDLTNEGLITDMLVSALRSNPAKPAFEVNWVNDWSTHLKPLLSTHEYDLGFPWLQPDCASTPEEYRCKNFKFSNPIFQMLVLLFVDKSRPFEFNEDADIEGAVLCRPNGYYTHDLEKDGRLWLTKNVIELKQPDSIEACFDMLIDGTVDAVALNEFTGRSAVANLSLKDKVEVLESRPLSIENLHVVAHKQHPRAQEMIDIVNDSMTELQLSDAYTAIIATHFRKFWSTIE